MTIKIVTFKIIGKSPLMQSNPASICADNVESALAVKKTYNDEEEAASRVYLNAEGQFVHPSAAFRSCMMVAVSGRKFNKKFARTLIAGGVFPAEMDCIILNGNGKPAQGYEIDKSPAVVNKARIPRCRPKFFPWSMLLPLEIDTELIHTEQVLQSLELGGRIIGIGEYRPDTSKQKTGIGSFGRFSAEIA